MPRTHARELAPDETLMHFIEDLPSGHCLIVCDCGKEQDDATDSCRSCKKFFVYRPWWEW